MLILKFFICLFIFEKGDKKAQLKNYIKKNLTLLI